MPEQSHDEDALLTGVVLGEPDDGGHGHESGVGLSLPAATLTAWRISSVVGTLVVVGVLIGFSQFAFAPGWLKANLVFICALFLAYSALEALVFDPLRHRYYSLHVFSQRLVISKGWMFRQVITIPHSSVLHLRLRRGPVLRRLGLTSVSVLTIADHQGIGPLDARQTELIEAFANGDVRDIHA